MERYKYTFILFSLFLFTLSSPLYANNNVFCENYAKLSVEQYKASIENACDFSGLRWNSNIENQKKWCLSVDELTASKETLARAEALIECRMAPVKLTDKELSYEEKEVFTQALIDAAIKDDIIEIKKLIIQGADINRELDGNFGTPLFAAIRAQSENAIRFFIEQGVDPQRTSNGGENPLNYVLEGNKEKLVNYTLLEYLLNNGLSPNGSGESGDTPLFTAIKANNTKAVKLLLQNGSNPNLQVNEPDTALNTAIKTAMQTNDVAIVKLLLEFGANPNISTDNQGCKQVYDDKSYANFPLALTEKNTLLQKLLLQFGAKDKRSCINSQS